MFEFVNYTLPIISLIASVIAVVFTVMKQKSETRNIDADTLSKFQGIIRGQEERFDRFEKKCKEVEKEFDTYKNLMNDQMGHLQMEAAKWRLWAERLSKQLRDHGIEPEPFP